MTSEPTKNLFEFLAKWGTPVGVVILLLLQGQFVSRKEFSEASDKMDTRIQKVEIALVQLVEQNKVNDRQDAIIIDHEKRLRELETHR